MSWVTVVGVLLVLVALGDIFHTLWHPRGFGSMAHRLMHLVWKGIGAVDRRERPTELTGPVGLLVVAFVWSALIVAGFMLIYLPHIRDGFHYASPLQPGETHDAVASVYLSLVAVGTLGFGDISPAEPWLRILVPMQALVGFVLLTAVISWVLQVYPTLAQRRALAKRMQLLRVTETLNLVRDGAPDLATQVLDSLVERITEVQVDLVQYGETYYFRERDPDISLAANLPYALMLAEAGEESSTPEVRRAAAMLRHAVGDLAHLIDDQFLKTGGNTREILRAFAADHRHEPAVPL